MRSNYAPVTLHIINANTIIVTMQVGEREKTLTNVTLTQTYPSYAPLICN